MLRQTGKGEGVCAVILYIISLTKGVSVCRITEIQSGKQINIFLYRKQLFHKVEFLI